jgi:hypothetical protein
VLEAVGVHVPEARHEEAAATLDGYERGRRSAFIDRRNDAILYDD